MTRLDNRPKCGAIADNGFDRHLPPTPYWCSKCEQTESQALKPCPFCGSDDIGSGEVLGEKGDKTRFVRTACLSCGAESGDGDNDTKADIKWNTRASEQHLKAKLLSDEMVKAVAVANSQWLKGVDYGYPRYHDLPEELKSKYHDQAKAALEAIVGQL